MLDNNSTKFQNADYSTKPKWTNTPIIPSRKNKKDDNNFAGCNNTDCFIIGDNSSLPTTTTTTATAAIIHATTMSSSNNFPLVNELQKRPMIPVPKLEAITENLWEDEENEV